VKPKLKQVTGLRQDDQEVEKPSLTVGDSIYYHHKEHGVAHGVVAAIGKHGCTTDADGGDTHQVRWEDFLGHRKRAERKLTIVDRGEDGSIMEDEDGKKVYVRGTLEDYEPKPLEKSIPGVLLETDPSLLEKAQVIRELSTAGFEPMMDYVKDTFGEHFVFKQPDVVVPDATGEALDRLSSVQGSQFQGLAAAISLLADRMAGADALQQSLMAALTEARKPIEINFTLTMPDKPPMAMKGSRAADGTMLLVPVEVPDGA
jgi:hypothetical protein